MSDNININSIDWNETLRHSRHKKNVNIFINKYNPNYVKEKYSNKTFEEIYTKIYKRSNKYKGVGKLSVYDITSAICKFVKTPIKQIILAGPGPIRAIKKLDLENKTKYTSIRLNDGTYLKCISIKYVENALKETNYKIEKPTDSVSLLFIGDHFESEICKWQNKGKYNGC